MVLLGFIDEPVGDEPTSFEDIFVGGQPSYFKDVRPPTEITNCKNCGGQLSLLLQAFAPFQDELYDRIIYVFMCPKAECSKKNGSVRAIRGVCKDPKLMEENKSQVEQEAEERVVEPVKDLFGELTLDSNPFASANPFSSGNPFDKKGKLHPAPVGYKTGENVTRIISILFLYVEEETLSPRKFNLPANMEIDESVLDAEIETEGSAKLKGSDIKQAIDDDDTFNAFTEKVEHNPSQVLRYHLGGKPLLYNSKDEIYQTIIKAKVPGKQFELQIMPKLIMDIEKDNFEMDWGTIIVYTDTNDAIELDEEFVGYKEEWCGVQYEQWNSPL
ncbi:uncharacterized protein PAS_chr1-4_0628 [Komagataella phaffii GS115]|uniref:Programmed cell death protein 2 C-terminal domain-containing protein n=1 Tax=Komagataella phaffii (strain GS115 / ATCC 20864) TaxID=644223 RepID=C4QZ14_KOMPG|nr:uncharacterized protein PAS_chr1-4_0628 [Komagataella phaffii GS115]CAY68488.1 hypothetical protein PAS_chr1-4_0628 [Komagataella phaffii GS115]